MSQDEFVLLLILANKTLSSAITRYFRRNEGTTDYATIPEVTLAGDFVVEFDAIINNASSLTGQIVIGNSENPTGFIRFNNGVLQLNTTTGGGLAVFDNIVLADNELTGFTISYVSSTSTLTATSSTGLSQSITFTVLSMVVDRIYSKHGKFMSGILANLKIWDNGTLIRDYPINDGKNILANAATALGSELDGLTYALTTAIGGVASVVLSSLSVIGKTYLVEVSYSGVVGDASVRIGGFSGPSFTGTGTIEFVATATTTVNDILGALTGVTSGSVTVSIKEAEGYGTIINGNASDWGLFDKQANGDWLGQELITQSNWENPSSIGSQWSFADDLWSLESDGTLNSLAIIPAASNPDRMRIEGDIISINQNRLSVLHTGGLGVGQFDSVGPYFYEWDLSVNGKQEFKRANGAANVTISKPSLKEVLQVS